MLIENAIDRINDVVLEYGDSTEKSIWEDIKLTAEFEEIYENQIYLFALSGVLDKYTKDTGKHKKINKAWECLINIILEDD